MPYHIISYQIIPCNNIPYHAISYLDIHVPCHIMPYHAISYLDIPCHIITCHVISNHAISYNIISHIGVPCHIIQYLISPCHIIQYHILPYHTMLYHTVLCHIKPFRTMQYHTVPHHIIPDMCTRQIMLYHIIHCDTIPCNTITVHVYKVSLSSLTLDWFLDQKYVYMYFESVDTCRGWKNRFSRGNSKLTSFDFVLMKWARAWMIKFFYENKRRNQVLCIITESLHFGGTSLKCTQSQTRSRCSQNAFSWCTTIYYTCIHTSYRSFIDATKQNAHIIHHQSFPIDFWAIIWQAEFSKISTVWKIVPAAIQNTSKQKSPRELNFLHLMSLILLREVADESSDLSRSPNNSNNLVSFHLIAFVQRTLTRFTLACTWNDS